MHEDNEEISEQLSKFERDHPPESLKDVQKCSLIFRRLCLGICLSLAQNDMHPIVRPLLLVSQQNNFPNSKEPYQVIFMFHLLFGSVA